LSDGSGRDKTLDVFAGVVELGQNFRRVRPDPRGSGRSIERLAVESEPRGSKAFVLPAIPFALLEIDRGAGVVPVT